MLDQVFEEVYEKFKLNLYKNMFRDFGEKGVSLSATETFCLEVIKALNKPTINELVDFLGLSQPNVTYKINSLVRKGYVVKVQSEKDKREFFLELTEKFYDYYGLKNEYISTVMRRLSKRISPEKSKEFEALLRLMSEELMPEVTSFMHDNEK